MAWLPRQFQNGGLPSRSFNTNFFNFGKWMSSMFTYYTRRLKKSKLSGVTFSLNAGGSPAMDGQASHPVKPWSQDWLIAAGAYPGFCSMKRLRVFLLPLDRMLVHHRSLPSNLLGFPPKQFAGTHLYSWVERGTVRVQCLA